MSRKFSGHALTNFDLGGERTLNISFFGDDARMMEVRPQTAAEKAMNSPGAHVEGAIVAYSQVRTRGDDVSLVMFMSESVNVSCKKSSSIRNRSR